MKKLGFLNNMKILITGNWGFIGSNLEPILEKKYGKIHVIGHDIRSGYDIFDSDFERLVKWSDVVIHLAAITSVDQSFKNPGIVYNTNVCGTARVASLCYTYDKKLIYPSSAAIYHPDLSPYAMSKKLAEDIVSHMDIKKVILRFFNVFGPHMNPNSGSVMYKFLTSNELVVYGDGEQTRDYIHVRDVCNIIMEAIQPSWNGMTVDVGTGQSYSTNYIAGLFGHYRGLKISYKAPRREIKWSKADTKVLKNLYKRKLTTDLEKDIKSLCLHQ